MCGCVGVLVCVCVIINTDVFHGDDAFSFVFFSMYTRFSLFEYVGCNKKSNPLCLRGKAGRQACIYVCISLYSERYLRRGGPYTQLTYMYAYTDTSSIHTRMHMCVCVCVCMYVCMYVVCMYVCMQVAYIHVCICVCTYV